MALKRRGQWVLAKVMAVDGVECADCHRTILRLTPVWRYLGSKLGRRICIRCMDRRMKIKQGRRTTR